MTDPKESSKSSASKKAAAPKTPSERKQGRSFEPDKQAKPNSVKRHAQLFTPDAHQSQTEIPQSITAGELLPSVSEYSSLKLDALPLKGLKSFLLAVVAVLITIVGWQLYELISFVSNQHWILAALLIVLLSVAALLSINLVVNFYKNQEDERALENIRALANELALNNDVKSGQDFIAQLSAFYANKPHAIHFERCLNSLPDYANDGEVLAHIDSVFLQALDQEALTRVSKYSTQTGLVVAASPWVIVDVVLALWRVMKMIDDVAQVYGMRPSRLNRIKLLKKVVHQLAFIAVSEVMIDELLEQMGIVSIVGIASSRIAQGLGASVYTAKIGIATMQVSRPCEFSSKPIKLAAILPQIASKLKRKSL